MNDIQNSRFSFVVIDAEGEPKASTEVIAAGVSVQHKNLISLLKRHESRFSRFGEVAFETRLNKQGSKTEYAMLNEPQAALLLTFTRNTNSTMDFKENLVHEFFAMRDALTHRDKNLWQKMQALMAKEIQSEIKASFGSHLMLSRKREIPHFRNERNQLESEIQQPLFLN